MPSEFKPDELIAAIVAKLKTALEGTAQVKQLAGEDVDANGDLVVKPPVVLVAWVKETPAVNRDNTRTSYQSEQLLDLFSGDMNLRSLEEETVGALALVSKVREQVAGARWTLGDGSKTQPTVLRETEIAQIGRNGTFYVTRIGVQHSAQFSGVNAGG
jgi:hypothetical protein